MTAHALFADEPFPADHATGFELGWDHAHYRVTPPAAHLTADSPLRQGYAAGVDTFGVRTLQATPAVRKWLQLRVGAWLRGRVFEGVHITPAYLQQLEVSHCPITRQPLTQGTSLPSDASVDRVFNAAAYAAGNLAVMSTGANRAKSQYDRDDALEFARQVRVGRLGSIDGLTEAQWLRIACLTSLVTSLSHEQAIAQPLLVLPPTRLHLLNPAQGLQALVTLQLARPGYSERVRRIEALISGKTLRRDFRLFFNALLPRFLAAGRLTEPLAIRWALEDAWSNELVQRNWARFARHITPTQIEVLLARTAKLAGLGGQRFRTVPTAAATEGWALESGGYVQARTRLGRRLAHRAPAPAALPPVPLAGAGWGKGPREQVPTCQTAPPQQTAFDWVALH